MVPGKAKTGEKAALEELITEDLEGPVLVPNFQGFLSSKLSKSKLRIITRENLPLVIERVIVWSPIRGEVRYNSVSICPARLINRRG